MRGGRKWLANLLVIGLSMAGALALAEMGVRVFAPQPTGLSHQDRYGLQMHYPGITRFLPQFGHDVSFNSAGMRDREHPLAKPRGTYRVLLLGDSFMEAVQVPFDSSFPSLMERELGQGGGVNAEVINAGVSGWGTDDELRYLTEYGLKYQPDLILVAMTLHNDISDNLRQEWHTARDGVLVERSVPPMSFWRYRIVVLKAYVASRFQLYQLWRRVRHGGEIRQGRAQLDSHVVQLFREPTPERIASGFGLTRLLLERLRAVAAMNDAKVVVVLLPLKVQLSDSSFATFARSAGATTAEMPIDKPQRWMTAVADSLGIPVIDLLPAFRRWSADSSAPLYMTRDGHWNEAGHALAVRVVVPGLRAAGIVP